MSRGMYRFRCELCGIGYVDMQSIKRHYAITHLKCLYCCFNCFLKFEDHDLYNKHLMEHWDNGNFKCFDCDGARASKGTLRTHVQSHLTKTKPNSILCEVCNKYFTRFQMSSHMKRHPDIENTVNCGKCDIACKTHNALSAHMQLEHCHYQCDGCDYIGRTWQDLDVHNSEEHEPRFFVECAECHLVYPTEKMLESHVASKHPMLSVRDLVKYRTDMKCSICGGIQRNLRALRSHLLTHSEYRGKREDGLSFIECKLCLLFYTTKRGFIKHAIMEHPGACNMEAYYIRKEVTCPFCDRKLSRVRSMNEHIKKHNYFREKQNSLGFIECTVCHLFYANQKASNVHLAQVHPGAVWHDVFRQRKDLKCSICDQSLKNIRSLNKHVTLHMLRDKKESKRYIRCRCCKLYFNVKHSFEAHVIKAHSESSPEELIEYVNEIKCWICSEVRIDAQSINGHIRRVHLRKKKQRKSKSE